MRKTQVTAPTHDNQGTKLWVKKGLKPPKLRFQAGTIFRLDGQLYELMYSYRIEDVPQEWHHYLEERKDLLDVGDKIHHLLLALGCGSKTPRVSYDVFRDTYAAWQFFADIPRQADGRSVTNKTLLRAEVVSSGLVTSTKIE